MKQQLGAVGVLPWRIIFVEIRQPRREQLPGNRLPCVPLGPPNFPNLYSPPDLFWDRIFVFNFFARGRIQFYVKPRTNEEKHQAEEEGGGGGEEEEENSGNPPQRANEARDFRKLFGGPHPTHSDNFFRHFFSGLQFFSGYNFFSD